MQDIRTLLVSNGLLRIIDSASFQALLFALYIFVRLCLFFKQFLLIVVVVVMFCELSLSYVSFCEIVLFA